MEGSPSADQTELLSWKFVREDLEIVDANSRLPAGGSGVEVRRGVIVEEHPDHDSVEAADGRHT
jgi:hypothetical protein